MISKNINNNNEVKVRHLGLYSQKMFESFEAVAYQSQEQVKGKQKQISKINKIGRKLPKIGKSECFKFNSEVDFSIQRQSLRRMGASEVGSMFIGTESVSKLVLERILKSIDREIPFQDNLSMRKGKVLENLAFDEFVRIYSDNIEVLYKNKYANGIDKYNYFKKYGKKDNLIGSTIDGWFINKEGESELLEIKCSDSIDLRSAVIEYNKTGNFLENKYFFKYYVQVQVQLACTGLSKGNLFFIIGNDAINCVIDRNDAFISKVMFGIEKLESEVNRIARYLKQNCDVKNINLDALITLIDNFFKASCLYNELSKSNYKIDFLDFVNSVDLDTNSYENQRLKGCLLEINDLQCKIDKVENDTKKKHKLELDKITKPIKDKLKLCINSVLGEFSLLEHIHYYLEGNLFSIDTTKRAIKDRFKSLGGDINFNFDSLDLDNDWSTSSISAV
ncbi:DUF244 domain-containing protein (plasmid) [Borrelia coriaceae]|uniref:DUF244 domain-containing protein n=1 Tax=Borrelia coriaceae TaxID=144 RepID=UPI001FF24CDC|nr:DUF244 domain-containing protein [Borrelia coriaceae]UPA16820.1 DUF244 domain-containing protein [Borrelia coriaceae]